MMLAFCAGGCKRPKLLCSFHFGAAIILALAAVFIFNVSAYSAQISIAWNPDSGQVAGYDVHYGTSTGSYTTTLDVGNVTGATLQNLTSPAYYIAVTAYDSNKNQSAYSPELVIYALTASAGAGGSISPAGSFFQSQGASQTFTITPASGYQATDVKVDGVSVGAFTSYTLSSIVASHTISASFSPQTSTKYTITASAGSNGSISPSGSATASSGSTHQFTITPNAGYTASVGGTCGGALSGSIYTTNPITANCTVSASFAINSYTVTPSAGSGGSISPSAAKAVNYNSTTSFILTPNTGYSISSVTGCGGTLTGSTYTTGPVTSNCTVTAAFTATKYTITASAGSNGSISPSGSATASSGSTHQFTITPNAGYTASVGGTCGGSLSGNIYTTNPITANCTVTPSFAINSYTVTPSAGSGGSMSPSTAKAVNYNGTTSFIVTPNTGHSTSSVTGCGGTLTGSTYTTGPITSNCTVTAAFTATIYTITASAGSNGSISPSSSVKVNSGSNQTFYITPAPNYKISDVKVDGKSMGAVSSYGFTNVNANHTISAAFVLTTYTISATIQGSGTISPSGTVSVLAGKNKVFTLTPSACYRVADVQVDGQSTGLASSGKSIPGYTFSNVSSNHTILAIFSKIPPPNVDPGPDQAVISGSTVTLNGSNSTDTLSGIASYKWIQVTPSSSASPGGGLQGSQVLLSNPSAPICTFNAPKVAQGTMFTFKLQVTNNAGITSASTCLVNVAGTDKAPLANAGTGQTVQPYTNVTLDASRSSDPDDGIASFAWVQLKGPQVAILNANTAHASFVAPNPGSLGVSMVFELRVADHFGLTTRDQCIVSVANANLPPVANAGPNKTVAAKSSVTLDGSGSYDPGGATLAYRWNQIRGMPVTLSDPAAKTPVFTAPAVSAAQSADLLFMLTVTNSAGLSSSNKCIVTVK